ncbi:MAG: hypothetical protein AAGM67_09750 [Bacteroidota bacterium]
MLDKLRHRLASGNLPLGPRLAIIAIALINLPGAIFGGLFIWTIIPIPALIIYSLVVYMAFGGGKTQTAETVSVFAIVYHAILLMALIGLNIDRMTHSSSEIEMLSTLGVMAYVAGPMGLYALILRMLRETPGK